ncbi:hypothetical protein Hte_012455 [Hypoxylon texense]
MTTMQLSEAYIILGLTPGASIEEIERAFRAKALIYHPDRVLQHGDKDEQESRYKMATEEMKVINNAKALLIEAVNAPPPEPAYAHTATPTKDSDPRHKDDGGRHGPAENEMIVVDAPNINLDDINPRESMRSKRGGGYTPTEDEYRDLLQDLADLHATVCGTADAIEELTHTRPYMTYWDHIWLTYHTAGATTEGVWDVVRYTWHKVLQATGRIDRGEWGKIKEFTRAARETIGECDGVITSWEPRDESKSCLGLYKALRKFPIAKRKMGDPSWRAQDRLMRETISVRRI